MQTLIGFLRDLGWLVTIGFGVLLIGVAIHYLHHWGETKKETAKRLADDAARKNKDYGPGSPRPERR